MSTDAASGTVERTAAMEAARRIVENCDKKGHVYGEIADEIEDGVTVARALLAAAERERRLREALEIMVAALDGYPPDDPEVSDWPSDPLGVMNDAIKNDFPKKARAALSPHAKEQGNG
jgi:hypothetical protein